MPFRRWCGALLVLSFVLTSPPARGQEGDVADDDGGGQVNKKAKPKEKHRAGDIAPTIGGLSGLFRTVSADIGTQHSFRVSLHTQLFTANDFLVQDDSHSRFIGTLAVNYTPWRMLEFFLNLRSMANNNDRPPEQGRLDPAVILALGDLSFGGKFQYPILPSLGIGVNTNVTFLNSVGGVSIDGSSTSWYGGLLTTFRLGKIIPKAPISAHLNAGYLLDNSSNLSSFTNYPLPSLQVETFSLGINPSRFQLKFGVDAQLRRWTKIGVSPIAEFGMDVATGNADQKFASFVGKTNGIQASELDGRVTAWLTLGARVNPIKGLIVEIASDIGLVSPGFGFGPPVVPWNLILGVSYAYDPKAKVVTKERVRTVVRKVGKVRRVGKVRGRVVNAKTMEPVQGAVITFPGRDLTGLSSDPDGGFLSYELEPGKVALMVRHPKYKPFKTMVSVQERQETKLEVKLQPAAPSGGTLTGTVVDTDNQPVNAQITIAGPENEKVSAADGGTFNAKLKPGEYTLTVSADGYLTKRQRVTVTAGGTATVSFTISKKPKKNLIKITKKRLVLRRKIHFATGTADLRPDAKGLLDVVVDTLLNTPAIQMVEVQGHTDNRGSKGYNMKLSQQRAETVRDYLVQNGVDSSRLVAKGYGPSRPKRPNITARNRALNRRVEFRIRRR